MIIVCYSKHKIMKVSATPLLNLQKSFLMMVMLMMMMRRRRRMTMTMTTTRTSYTDQNVFENNSSLLNPLILIKVYSTRYISVI